MRKIILSISTLLFCALQLSAQNNVEFTKENLKNNKDLKKVYTNYVKKGDKFYFGHERGYLVALEYYMMAYNEHPSSAMLNYKIADCYLHTLYKYKALPHAIKAYELNPKVSFDIDYVIGMGYHQVQDFDNAIAYYNKFMTNYSGKNADTLAMAKRKVVECGNGKELVKENVYEVVNMGPDVNSEYAEYVPLVKADKSYMLFTSRRPQQKVDLANTSKKIRGERLSKFDMDYHEDIFKTINESDTSWSQPCRFDYSTRKNSLHDACVSLSYDGATIYNYRGNNNGDLYTATIKDGKWTKTVPLKGINTKYREDHIAVAFDNKTAYFVSDRPGGQGGKDIWQSTRINENEWSTPVNLGPMVNTAFDEEGVFIHPDGKTIYFSSRGHNTMGGFDVFETTFEDGKWTTPLNMGYPTNSPDDDVFFILSSDGKTAYLSSVKEGGYGMQDIYAIGTFEKKKDKRKDKDPEFVSYKGYVVDKDSKTKLKAKIEIIDNSTGLKVYTEEVDDKNGYTVALPSDKKHKSYTINVTVEGYVVYTETVDVSGNKEIDKNIELEKVKVVISNVIILDHVYFDYDKAHIKDESRPELDSALMYLNANPEIKIEIEGHTDNVGSADYNLKLSQDRANSVRDYLISKGFDPKRILKVTGFGNTRPLVQGDSEDAKSKNRRVEFELIR